MLDSICSDRNSAGQRARRARPASSACGAAPRTTTASTSSTAAPCACSARSGRARRRRSPPRSLHRGVLPVSVRTSTNMPTADATIAPSSSRLWTSIGGTPAHSSGVADEPLDDHRVGIGQRPPLGVKDVAVEQAGWRRPQRVGEPAEPPQVEVDVLVLRPARRQVFDLRPGHRRGEHDEQQRHTRDPQCRRPAVRPATLTDRCQSAS